MCRSWILLLYTALAWPGQSSGAAAAQPAPPEPGPGCTAATEKLPYPTYWLGPNFRGLEVSEVLLECRRGWTTVIYLYGDCTPQGGSCALPLDIQNYPPELRNRAMYSAGPAPFELHGEDTTVDGAPATNWGGHVDVYRRETTVAIFGDAAPKLEVARNLVRAPSTPATLARHGLFFDPECIDRTVYCQADRSLASEDAEGLTNVLVFYGVLFGIPLALALLVGGIWVLAVPVLLWAGYYVMASIGWLATGETWQFFAILMWFFSMVVAGVGLLLRAGISRIRSRSRVEPIA